MVAAAGVRSVTRRRFFSERCADLLRFVRGYQMAHGGDSPSITCCSTALGYKSPSGALTPMRLLERSGQIRIVRGSARLSATNDIIILRDVAVPSINGDPLYFVPIGQFRDVRTGQGD